DPIMLRTVNTKDIQFQLVQCPVGQKRSDQDSNKIEKEKQIRDGGHNEDLINFVFGVCDLWRLLELPHCFDKIEQDYEFYGVLPSKASVSFALWDCSSNHCKP
ncbi:hypothetical protein MKX01_013334, partial [Papaver californicum]